MDRNQWHVAKLLFGLAVFYVVLDSVLAAPLYTQVKAGVLAVGYCVCSFMALPEDTGK